ncbi:MFS transporter [Streptosporangium algeriense]|uniref:MFS transporter n=1 Tax=Streptosporangium algeriense TaxID=1682748 RepID=A0ABW3DQ86_9ACTN
MENVSTRRSGQALLVWGLLVVAANLRASLTGVGPLLDQVQADLGLVPAVAGLLNTLPLLTFVVLSPLVPRLAARWGAERLLGGALMVLTLGIALRWVPAAAGLFTGTVLIGAGVAVGNVLLPSLIKRDFPTRVGLLTSAYATVMGGVAAVASGVAVPISEVAPGGWYTALGCWVLFALVAVLLWLPRMRAPRRAAQAVSGTGCRGVPGWRGRSRRSWDYSRWASTSS